MGKAGKNYPSAGSDISEEAVDPHDFDSMHGSSISTSVLDRIGNAGSGQPRNG